MFEDLIVYAAVGCAAIYASWRLLPATARFSLAEHGATLAQRLGFAQPEPDAARRRADARAKGGCGGCSGCSGRKTTQASQQVVFINRKKGS